MPSKIALGTVQFGLDYGINNDSGIPSDMVLQDIFDLAKKGSIDTIDTSLAYGNSEHRLAPHISNNEFKVISKFNEYSKKGVQHELERTLKNLGTQKIYGYLVHSFKMVKQNQSILEELQELKSKNLIDKIGVSLYHPDELEWLFDRELSVDIIQIPYNIFDRRFEPYLQKAKAKGIEIHARSIYLQGLFFRNPECLSEDFLEIKQSISSLRSFALEHNVKLSQLLMHMAMVNENLDRLVIGAERSKFVQEALSYSKNDFPNETLDFLETFECSNLNIILPYKWKV